MTNPIEVPGAYPVIAPVDVVEDVLVAVGGRVGKPLSVALGGQPVYVTNDASWLLAVPSGTKAFDELYAVGQSPFSDGLLALSRTATGNTLIGRSLTDRDHAGRAVVLLSVASIEGGGGVPIYIQTTDPAGGPGFPDDNALWIIPDEDDGGPGVLWARKNGDWWQIGVANASTLTGASTDVSLLIGNEVRSQFYWDQDKVGMKFYDPNDAGKLMRVQITSSRGLSLEGTYGARSINVGPEYPTAPFAPFASFPGNAGDLFLQAVADNRGLLWVAASHIDSSPEWELAVPFVGTTPPSNGINQGTQVERSYSVDAGVFRLTIFGDETTDIPQDVTGDEFIAILEVLPSIGAGNVVLRDAGLGPQNWGGLPGGFTFDFINALGGQFFPFPYVIVSANSLTYLGDPVEPIVISQSPAGEQPTPYQPPFNSVYNDRAHGVAWWNHGTPGSPNWQRYAGRAPGLPKITRATGRFVVPSGTDFDIAFGPYDPDTFLGLQYLRADWDNANDLAIPGQGAFLIAVQAEADSGGGSPFVAGTTNLFVEIVADAFDFAAGNVVGRNVLDAGTFPIYDGSSYDARVTTIAFHASDNLYNIPIHVQHDAGADMRVQLKLLVIWVPS